MSGSRAKQVKNFSRETALLDSPGLERDAGLAAIFDDARVIRRQGSEEGAA
jgi:hypothetical protein